MTEVDPEINKDELSKEAHDVNAAAEVDRAALGAKPLSRETSPTIGEVKHKQEILAQDKKTEIQMQRAMQDLKTQKQTERAMEDLKVQQQTEKAVGEENAIQRILHRFTRRSDKAA